MNASPHTAGAAQQTGESIGRRQFAGRRAVAVLFSTYPSDPRPRRAAEALVKEGFDVEVICLKPEPGEPGNDSVNGVRITRIPLKSRRGGKIIYIAQYACFTLIAFAILAFRSLQRRYDLVHVHNMPDFLVFSALVPRLLGARVILDLHDPMPELMMTIFGLDRESLAVRVLKTVEKLSLAFADAVVTVNEACKNIFSSRSCAPAKVTVVMNSPDPDIFRYRPAGPAPVIKQDHLRPFVIMYHGSLVERHGLDIAVAALAKVRQTIPHVGLVIYGQNTPFLLQVMASVEQSPVRDAVRYLGRKNLEEIVDGIRNSDVGIIPNRRSIFTELNTPTRIFEYLSQGKPVIAPRAPGILDYFQEEDLILFELGNANDLASKIEYVFSHPQEVRKVLERGQAVYRAHDWNTERVRFLRLVDGLLPASHVIERRGRRAVAIGSNE